MAHRTTSLLCLSILVLGSAGLKTCPGFPGYCSESFPGQTCNVVCSFGRNNVPLCQDDGTWTDIPRCIEHEPGVDEQIPGICPGIPGYCAQGFLHQRCNFDCATGADIDSLCTSDGTWQPYPVCQGDQRETRDGCDGCPGPLGRARNRTAEALLANSVQTNRVPKSGSIGGSGNRQTVPSFAGTTRFGKIDNQPARNNLNPSSFFVGNDGTIQDRPTQAQRDQAAQRQANVERQLAIQRQQAAERQRQEAAERQRQEAAERQRQEAAERQRQEAVRRQQAAQQQQQQQTAFRQQQQQPAFRTQQQQPAQQQPFQQGLNTFQPNRPANQPLTGGSLFNQIKNNINNGHRLRAEQEKRQQQQQQQQQPARQAGQSSLPVSNFLPEIDELLLQQQQQLEQQQQQEQLEQRRRQQQQFQQNQQQFGVFETVNLGGPPTSPPVQQPRAIQRTPSSPPANNQDFFGEFPSVNLQARI